ncbi:MAG TPA: hypothetical protein DCQ58_09795, partial [Saprospirales bacterium]|nr:hypothetical protein [Saprospirales bacterium]
KDCVIDYVGNLYFIGYFNSETLQTGSTILSPFIGWDLLVIKLNQDGNVLWSRNFGGDGNEYGLSCAILSNGNIILSGEFYGELMHFGNVLTHNPNCGTQFYAELEPDADIVGAFTLQECNDVNTTSGLKCISSGTSCIFYLLGSDYNNKRVFLHELGCGGIPNYNFLNISTSSDGEAFLERAAVDPIGNIYVWGRFDSQTIEISASGSSNKVKLMNKSNYKTSDIFLLKISYDHKLLWAKSFGSKDYDNINSCSVKNNGGIFITGTFGLPTILFDNFELKHDATLVGDIFVVELNSNGDVIWAESTKATGFYNPKNTIDKNDNLYLYGEYTGECTFGSFTLDNAIGKDYSFLCKLGITSSLEKVNADSEVLINPNPNQGNFLIKILDDSKFNKIEILDLDGKVLWTQRLNEMIDEQATSLPSHIQNGTYIIKLSNLNGKQILQKIIVNH